MRNTKSYWVKCSDRLPEDNGSYHYVFICCDVFGLPQSVGVGYYDHEKQVWVDDNDEELQVDYWMEVPGFPDKVTENPVKVKKIYVAGPIEKNAGDVSLVVSLLRDKGFNVYCPFEHHIDHAWDYPNSEWGLMVFESDVHAINDSDYVVILSYGRNSTAGSNWEAGYAFGIGKKVIVVEMTYNPMSLMVANGRYATVRGLSGLEQYDWVNMPKTRTDTEQK